MAVILPQTLQSDLQSSLPVIPNNGNPGGAYNMAPIPEARTEASIAAQDPYAWLKPSQYMQTVDDLIRNQDLNFEQAMFEIKNPQDKQNYNLVIQDGSINVLPLNDYGMTMGADAFDDEPLTYTLPNGLDKLPQYIPVLPEE